MKKILFVLAAVVTLSFTSCGNKTTSGAANDSTATDTTVVDSTASDSAVADSTVCPM